MSKVTFKERGKAFIGHLLFSMVLLFIALYLLYFAWYPQPLVTAMGVMQIYLIVLGIDLILGPLLTAVVYKHDKKVFLRDLTIILILQLSAFFYGLYTIERGRPAFAVFVVDDIELVSPVSVKTQNLSQDIGYHLLSKPLWIGAPFSDDPVVNKEQKQAEIVDGNAMVFRTEYYRPLEQYAQKIVQKMNAVEKLSQFNSTEEVKFQLSQYPQAVGWLPVKAPQVDMVALYDKDGKPLAIVDLRPWK